MFDAVVVLYRPDRETGQIIPINEIVPLSIDQDSNSREIHLIYDGIHYDSFVTVDSPELGNFVVGSPLLSQPIEGKYFIFTLLTR